MADGLSHRNQGAVNGPPPNKRLKLAGGGRFRGTGGLCPGGHGLFVHYSCAAGESPQLKRDRLGGA